LKIDLSLLGVLWYIGGRLVRSRDPNEKSVLLGAAYLKIYQETKNQVQEVGHMLLSQAWSVYEADKRLLGYSPHTLKAYKLQFKLLIRHFGDIDLGDFSFEGLKQYLVAQEHLKPASLGHRIRFVKSLFRWAQDEGYITGNPASRLREPKMGTRVPKAMSEEDVVELQEGCESLLEHALVEFIYTTGCRIGEVANLNRNAINWEDRSAVVRGKGDKEREVYFTNKCAIWLKKYLRSRKDADMALFVTERAPHRMSIAQIRYILKRVAKRSGVQVNVYPHRLRHSYATHLLNNGAPLEVIQSLLGHTKLETTRLYAQLSGEHRRQLYKKYF
jgi:integrase/recombinase XerD